MGAIRYKKRQQKKRRRARLETHRALNIGTGLVPLFQSQTRASDLIPYTVILKAIYFHMAAQREQERQRRQRVVDSTLIYVVG